ncbi:MAG TPA: STAS domain-containing protein [Steroidobacteraceae bacterium]|nr:STAS domain-containing protein [Steroidobacteraceae bacterium]
MGMERATAQLADRGAGRCTLSGALTLETVPWVWQELSAGGLRETAVDADLTAVTDADSAGLALLIAWSASSRAAGGQLHFTGMPARLVALAQLTDAGALLEPAAGAGAAD